MVTRFNPLDARNGSSPSAAMRGLSDALIDVGSIAELRALAPLPEDAQKVIDQSVIDVGLQRLTIVRDLLASNFTFPLDDPLSVLELQWDVQSKSGGAQRTMHPEARGQNQLIDRISKRIPIYLTTDDFQFPLRLLRASQRVGAPLDVSHARQAVRRVNEALEDAAWNGATTFGGTLFTVNGNSAPGILNHADVNTYQYLGGATGRAWDDATKTGAHILADVLDMIDVLEQDFFYGPYRLYVPRTYGLKLSEDYKAESGITIRERLLAIPGITGIEVADQLPANRVALINWTEETIDLITGQEPTVLSWADPSGLGGRKFLVMAIMVPRVKSDYDGNSGIVLGNTT